MHTSSRFIVTILTLLFLICAIGATAQELIQLNYEVSGGFHGEGFNLDGLQIQVVFDPNSPVISDNGLNVRRWDVIEIKVCGELVTSAHALQATHIPSQNRSNISLLSAQMETPSVWNIELNGTFAFVLGMGHEDPWPTDSGGWAQSTSYNFFSFFSSGETECWSMPEVSLETLIDALAYSVDVQYIPNELTAVEDGIPGINSLKLSAFPNPFNPHITLNYELPESRDIRVSILDIRGRRIRALDKGFKSSGSHELIWNGLDDQGSELPSGTYLAEIRSRDERYSHKISLVR